MKVLLFSSDIKGFTYLKSIFKELKDKNHDAFLLYGNSNSIISHPPSNLDKFNYDSTFDIDFSKGEYVKSLGLNIPFIPDYLILTRDRWEPEQGIICEIKQKFPNTKIAYIELNTNLIHAIELKMELISRTKFPQNQIDIIFDHSTFCLNNKKTSLDWEGWSRGIVVGNPCWDSYNINQNQIHECFQKYNIDKNKTQILFFGTVDGSRYEVFKCLDFISQNLDLSLYQLYFKPYPGETNHPLFAKDYIPKFKIENINGIIFDQNDLLPMSYICNYHISTIGSVNYGGILFNKQIVNLDNFLNINKLYNDLDSFLQNNNIGSESYNADFWMRVHNLPTQQSFINLLGLDSLEKFKEHNLLWQDIINKYTHSFNFNLKFLTDPLKDTSKLLSYFDDFGDGKASKRIVKELEKLV